MSRTTSSWWTPLAALSACMLVIGFTGCGPESSSPTDPPLMVRSGDGWSCAAMPRNTTSFTLAPASASITVGQSITITAVNQSGVTLPLCQMSVSSSNAAIAGVFDAWNTQLTGVSVGGPVTITAKWHSLAATMQVTVTP